MQRLVFVVAVLPLAAVLAAGRLTLPAAQPAGSPKSGPPPGEVLSASSSAPGIDHVSAALLNAALDATMRSGAKGVQFRLADDRNAQYLKNRRTVPSEIELHCDWDDLMVVRAGAGVVTSSRRVHKPVKYSWGEWRAARLVTPNEFTIATGDVVRIPAGHAHQVRPLGDVPLVYLVVKVRSWEAGAVCGSLERAAREGARGAGR